MNSIFEEVVERDRRRRAASIASNASRKDEVAASNDKAKSGAGSEAEKSNETTAKGKTDSAEGNADQVPCICAALLDLCQPLSQDDNSKQGNASTTKG